MKLLAVDDERRCLEATARALRPLGRVETAQTADEAWSRFQELPFDLVVSDQRMPGMSGVELLSRVAERDPTVGRVLVTGYADLEATVDAINQGRIHRYLHKPWKPQQLLDCVRAVADEMRLERENTSLAEEIAARNCALEHALQTLRSSRQVDGPGRQVEELARRLSEFEDEMRQGLSLISSHTAEIQRLGTNLPEARLLELARDAFEESRRLIGLHGEIFEPKRAGRAPVALVEQELDPVLEAVRAELEAEAARVGVALETDLTSGARLLIDCERLRGACLHVALNALEAMRHGGRLRISTAREGREVAIGFADTGPGVPEEIREQLFDAFVTSGKPGANGLGLSVVRTVLEEHGGRVEFEDREGGGTVFWLRLPLDHTRAAA